MSNIKKANYFIEESVFLENDFYKFLDEELDKKSVIYVDKNIKNSIDNYGKMGMVGEQYLLDGLYNTIKEKGVLKEIDTKGYFDIKELKKECEIIKNLIVVTQKETIFQTFKSLISETINIYKFVNGKLDKWVDTQIKETEAFYIKNDIYLNQIETDMIDYVFSPKYGYLKLDKENVRSGGEGACYSSYKNLYCKVYNKKHLTYTNLKKLQAMLNMDVFNPYIVWPKDLLYYNNDFVGYVMEQVKDAKSLIELKDEGFEKYRLPSQRARICLNLLKNIEYLHKKGVLIGDLKDDNILVKSPDEVYIIDSGSFQIEDYACDVFTRGWTDKNYKGDDLNKNLRKLEDEYYPINKIIFELMILKNPHYSKKNIEIDYDNQKGFDFPLNIDKINGDSPNYLISWAMLSERMREYFYYYFIDSNKRRVTYINDWIKEFELLVKTYDDMMGRGDLNG